MREDPSFSTSPHKADSHKLERQRFYSVKLLLRELRFQDRMEARKEPTAPESKSVSETWDKLSCSKFKTYLKVRFYYTQLIDEIMRLGEVADSPNSLLSQVTEPGSVWGSAGDQSSSPSYCSCSGLLNLLRLQILHAAQCQGIRTSIKNHKRCCRWTSKGDRFYWKIFYQYPSPKFANQIFDCITKTTYKWHKCSVLVIFQNIFINKNNI